MKLLRIRAESERAEPLTFGLADGTYHTITRAGSVVEDAVAQHGVEQFTATLEAVEVPSPPVVEPPPVAEAPPMPEPLETQSGTAEAV